MMLHTTRVYPCGCTAAGSGDVPNYCPDHGEAPKGLSCHWYRQDIDDNTWDTTCRQSFCIEDDGPAANGFKFCCYCGGALIEDPMEDDDDEDAACPHLVGL
jgi:hypothetical protein